jgi:hypothetical protein
VSGRPGGALKSADTDSKTQTRGRELRPEGRGVLGRARKARIEDLENVTHGGAREHRAVIDHAEVRGKAGHPHLAAA